MAPTEELKKALLQQKTPGISDDYLGTLAKLVDMDEKLVLRVLVGYEAMKDAGGFWGSMPFCTGPELKPRELRDALVLAANMSVTRIEIAKRIHRGQRFSVPIELLLPPHREAELCSNCDHHLECLAEPKSSPHACYRTTYRNQPVMPLSMTQTEVTVEATMPQGIFKIALKDLCPTEGEVYSGRTQGHQ